MSTDLLRAQTNSGTCMFTAGFKYSIGPPVVTPSDHNGEMEDPDDDEPMTLTSPAAPHPEPAKTVLPASLATLISLVTSTSSLSLKVGSFCGQAAINLARFGTLGGLELGRVILEGLLFRAGQDVVETSKGSLGRATAESLLEGAVSL